MDLTERRGLLTTVANPDAGLDYVSELRGEIPDPGSGGDSSVILRCVPDRRVLLPDAFSRYLEALADLSWTSLEEIATTVLTDVNNEVIARWIQVSVRVGATRYPRVREYGVIVEDRQPDWDNAALLSRLPQV